MMRSIFLITLLLSAACDARLTEEQKKRIREEMRAGRIRKVTDAELTEAALKRGRALFGALTTLSGDSASVDSMIDAHNGRIRWITPAAQNASEMEKALVDAYLSAETGGLGDNIQKVRRGQEDTDSILYTRPVIVQQPDGTETLHGVWSIWLSRKELILAMDDEGN